MKAVLYRHGRNPGQADERIVLAENAVAVHQVVGEIVTIHQGVGASTVTTAAVRLGERDYIKWEEE